MFFLFLICCGYAVQLSNDTIANLLLNNTLDVNLLGNPYFNITLELTYVAGITNVFWQSSSYSEMGAQTLCSSIYFTSVCAEPAYNMVFDLNTAGQSLRQAFSLTSTDLFLFTIKYIPYYMPPATNYMIGIAFNGIKVDSFQQFYGDWIPASRQLIVQLDPGTTTVEVIQDPSGSIVIDQITLQKFVPIVQVVNGSIVLNGSTILNGSTVLNGSNELNGWNGLNELYDVLHSIILNDGVSSINKIPGNRAFLYTLTNFLCFFDRLQFYYYHDQNFSESAQTFLSIVNILQNEKSNYPQEIVQECQLSVCTSLQEVYENIMEVLDKKKAYSDQEFLEKNENGVGFMANFLDYFFYELPVMVLIFLLLNVLFRLLFNYRISVNIRKYSLWGALFLVFYEGNMEQFSFYYFLELQIFFSISPLHKGTNCFVIFFFGIAVIFGVGGLIFFKYHYGKLAKYLIDESKGRKVPLLVLESMEKSIYPFLFGCVHALFRESLGLQTTVLIILEVGYYATKLINIRSKFTAHRFRVMILSITSLLRLVFIVTLFFYQTCGQPLIINEIHLQFVWIYIGTCALELFIDILLFLQTPVEELLIYLNSQKMKSQKEKQKELKAKSKLKVQITAKTTEKVDCSLVKKGKEEQKWTRFKEMKKNYSLQGKPVVMEIKIIDIEGGNKEGQICETVKKGKKVGEISETFKDGKHSGKNKVTFKEEDVIKKMKPIEEGSTFQKRERKARTPR